MKFTPKESKKLSNRGFYKSDTSYAMEYTNGIIVLTAEKVAKNEFILYNDMSGGEDFLRANNNKTFNGLTFKELLEEIEGSF